MTVSLKVTHSTTLAGWFPFQVRIADTTPPEWVKNDADSLVPLGVRHSTLGLGRPRLTQVREELPVLFLGRRKVREGECVSTRRFEFG